MADVETYRPEGDSAPIGTRRIGKVMRSVVEAIEAHEAAGGTPQRHFRYGNSSRDSFGMSINELGVAIFGDAPTETQRRSILRAVRSLEAAGIVWTNRVGLAARRFGRRAEEYCGHGAPPVWGIEVHRSGPLAAGAYETFLAKSGLIGPPSSEKENL